MLTEAQKRREKAYKNRLKEKGIRDRHIWLDDQQWEVVHAFAVCVRKVKNLKYVVGLDTSNNYLDYHIVLDPSVIDGGVIKDEQ